MFSSLRDKLSSSTKKLSNALKSEIVLDKSALDSLLFDLEISLLESDVALEVVDRIKGDVIEELSGAKVEKSNIDRLIKDTLKRSLKNLFVEGDLVKEVREGKHPFVIVFIGVNGTGKTTTIAKVASLLKSEGLSCVIAAADTYRAGAIEQIEKHANNVGIKLVKHGRGADSAAVAFDAVEHGRAKGVDAVLVDTAGRMDTNVNLMDELRKVVRVCKPDLTIFVGDALTGNSVVDQVSTFNTYTPVEGVILTKADADAKGGSAISAAYTLKKPIYFLGTGQEYDDLMRFDPEWFVDEVLP